ncbi:MAG TPA: NAD(P)-binding protein [Anaeromyxobacteraceae bacterium]|jgi:NADPH-dependent glutamate synthase beta subunit-like oxidoreductase
MALLKKVDKAKPLKAVGRGGGGGGVSALRPQQVPKQAPCLAECPAGNDIRGWLNAISQHTKMGKSIDEALDAAFERLAETNPIPAVLGRVCPHPCETGCNRKDKDSPVGINSVERFLGDWALERKLPLPIAAAPGSQAEKIAVVGAGPAGLSCAYHLARRGYRVTVFESLPEAGGMLRYGIPDYRLPREVLAAEVARIAALGVEIRCGTAVGRDVGLDGLQRDHDAVFVAIGAHQGKQIRVEGEGGPGVYTGTGFLRQVAMGTPPPIGGKVAVIGGGDTAVDAARVSRRLATDAADVARKLGAEVTLFYRRTRTEMPAIEEEVVGAVEEGVKIEFLAAPARLVRDESGKLVKLVVERMKLGEPDASGRRAPVPTGELAEHDCDTVITAVSQEPDFKSLGGSLGDVRWLEADGWGKTSLAKVWTGGDDVNLALATTAVGQGRRAAESIHAALRGEQPREPAGGPPLGPSRLKLDFYEARPRAERGRLDPATRLARPHAEIDQGIGKEQVLAESARCLSCGLCFGCERCWMFCTPSCFGKVAEPAPGTYYRIKLDTCDGCRKCADECPCGFLDMA